MSNPLRVRIWAKNWTKPQMVTPGDISLFPQKTAQDVLNFLSDPDTYIPMRATGIVDIDKKEIFEGDIVKVNQVWTQDTYIVRFGQFKHQEGMNFLGWHLEYIRLSKLYSSPLSYGSGLNLKVIGNIYENPELLRANADYAMST